RCFTKILHTLPGGPATSAIDGNPAAAPPFVRADGGACTGEIHAQRLAGVDLDVSFPVTDDNPAVQPFQGWPLRVELQGPVTDVVVHLQGPLLGAAAPQHGATIDQSTVAAVSVNHGRLQPGHV